MATSVIDYVFRLLGMEYLEKTDFVQVPPKKEELRSYQNRMKKQMQELSNPLLVADREQQTPQTKEVSTLVEATETSSTNLDAIRASSGAPLCIDCGGMTKRNGSCYVCLDCGATTGCS
jgi:ribonucleoside-diphosphate reductase alpha chain